MDRSRDIILDINNPEIDLNITDVERDSLVLNIIFSGSLLAKYCEIYDLKSFDNLEAHLHAAAWGKEGLKLAGNITAQYVQDSIVSLKPITQKLSVEFSRRYSAGKYQNDHDQAEIEIDPLKEDPPENLTGGKILLGALILEVFALEMDLYPRLEGEAIDAQYLADEPSEYGGEKTSPFSVLKDFKSRNNAQ